MRNVTSLMTLVLGLGWVVIGAIIGSVVAIVVGVVLLVLGVAVPVLQRRAADRDRPGG